MEKVKRFLQVSFGYGSGDGSGYGYGDGSGYGSGSDILSMNKQKIYYLDKVQTIIISIHNNIANGFIVNSNLTLSKCFVAKVGNYFAHGKTIKDALRDANIKYINNLPIEQRISNFVAKFKLNVKYIAEELSLQHQVLTGSCEQGRLSFMSNHNIKLTDKLTVKEFIKITRDAFDSNIIRQLEKEYHEYK